MITKEFINSLLYLKKRSMLSIYHKSISTFNAATTTRVNSTRKGFDLL